jgi:hypothetical protein
MTLTGKRLFVPSLLILVLGMVDIMKMLRITGAKDGLVWYAPLIGELVPFCGRWPEAYKSLEPAGYLNRVEFADAELVELAADGTLTVLDA